MLKNSIRLASEFLTSILNAAPYMQSAQLKNAIIFGIAAIAALNPPSASAGYVQTYLDARGGCEVSHAPMSLLEEHVLPSYRFLGKEAAEWTEEDIADFRQVYAACLRRWPGSVMNIFRAGEPVMPPAGAIEAKVDKRVDEITKKFILPGRAQRRQADAVADAEFDLSRARERAKRAAEAKRAQADKEAFERSAKAAEDDARARREAITRQAQNDKDAAKRVAGIAEREGPLAQAAEREAQEARRNRASAEKQLEDVRRGTLAAQQSQRADEVAQKKAQAKRAEIERQVQNQREDQALAKDCSVSAEQFGRVKLGMSLRDVRHSFGCVGTLNSSTEVQGVGVFSVYQWHGAKSGTAAVTTFNNDTLVSKSQNALD